MHNLEKLVTGEGKENLNNLRPPWPIGKTGYDQYLWVQANGSDGELVRRNQLKYLSPGAMVPERIQVDRSGYSNFDRKCKEEEKIPKRFQIGNEDDKGSMYVYLCDDTKQLLIKEYLRLPIEMRKEVLRAVPDKERKKMKYSALEWRMTLQKFLVTPPLSHVALPIFGFVF